MDINEEPPKTGQKVYSATNRDEVPEWYKDQSRLIFELVGTVTRIDGGICYYKKLNDEHNLFIWDTRGTDKGTLNKLHRWR